MCSQTANFYADDEVPPLLVLEENRFAHAALSRLNESTGYCGNGIVFIYGPSGAGKSHLVRAFVSEVRRRRTDAAIAHVTASQLAAELAAAFEAGSVDEFQQLYGNVDILVCEDLQALRRRYETQRQLIALMDEIGRLGGCVVLTCKHSPGTLSHTLPRLINRCHSGTCVPVGLPAHGSRLALLQHFARTRQVPLAEQAIRNLAARLPVSPRELLAAAKQLQMTSHGSDSPTIADRLADDFLEADAAPHQPTIAEISRIVAGLFGVRVSELRSPKRLHRLTLPRQCAMYLCRELTTEPLAKIGRYFRRPNHSTVAHACDRVRRMLPENPQLRQQLSRLCELLAPGGAAALTTTLKASTNC